ADAASGKRTLVVMIGIRGSLWLAAASLFVAVALAALLHHAAGIEALGGVAAFAGLHAIALAPALLREAERGRRAQRSDAWTAAPPRSSLGSGLIPLVNRLRA